MWTTTSHKYGGPNNSLRFRTIYKVLETLSNIQAQVYSMSSYETQVTSSNNIENQCLTLCNPETHCDKKHFNAFVC